MHVLATVFSPFTYLRAICVTTKRRQLLVKTLFFPYALPLSRVKLVAGKVVKWEKCNCLLEVALNVFLTQNCHLHLAGNSFKLFGVA